VLDALAEQGLSPTAWDDVEHATSRIDLFLDGAADVPAACCAMRLAGEALGLDLQPVVTDLPAQDWAESWKRFFRVQRVSDRVVIRPTWEPYAASPGDCVVNLDPGMSFGTGNHGTTRACLIFLDRLASEDADRRVLDMGCGSGILSIAARKLGFSEVAGFDVDPDAVAIALGNAGANGVSVQLETCDLACNTRQAEVVVANILAPVLIEFADPVTAAVAPGGRGALVLSGILDTQYAGVRAAYEARGFAEMSSLLIDEWRSGLFVRHAGSTGNRGPRDP
jgi:ribosomal protein L11 methyltransferase